MRPPGPKLGLRGASYTFRADKQNRELAGLPRGNILRGHFKIPRDTDVFMPDSSPVVRLDKGLGQSPK
jgi:hypothetical protein